MKYNRILFLLAWLIILPGIYGCSAEKQMAERRNLMIPQRDELPKNSKFRSAKKRKTYKPKKKKRNKRKGYSCIDAFSEPQNRQA